MLQCYSTPGLFWFRIFGKGLAIKDIHKHPLMFSQRMGINCVRFGNYCVSFLK